MNFIKSVRENLKDPKKKSLTLIGIYLVFFIIVFALINAGEESPAPKKGIPEKKVEDKAISDEENYEYTITIYDSENIYKVMGSYIDGVDEISYSDIDFNHTDYEYGLLKEIEENSDSETKYRDSDIISYKISANKYFELVNESQYCDTSDCSMLITVDIDNSTNKVVIDLTSYYNYDYKIEIEYSFLDNME